MKVLIVCSITTNIISPFIEEQATSLQNKGIEVDFFYIKRKGILGYLKTLPGLKRKIKEFKPDLIHSHFGLSGLLANLQRKVPVISTYHGTDINKKSFLFFSSISAILSAYNIFVHNKLALKVKIKRKFKIIPCGIDLQTFVVKDKAIARKIHNLDPQKKYALFSSRFTKEVKNAPLAFESLKLVDEEIELIELIGYKREEVCSLLNAVDVALLTSFSEGSPQFIKEAMACDCPAVSTDVGDVKERISNIDGYFITSYEPEDIASKINEAIKFGKTNAREKIQNLDLKNIAEEIISIYQSVLKN
jgi:glycosyltransferase involved in cell wall biosynthesis